MSAVMRLRLLAGAGLLLALALGGCGSGGQLGPKDLSEQSRGLQSAAAEGALLAGDAASGRTTQVYVREHSSDLSTIASQAEDTLTSASTEPALESTRRRLAVLAEQVSADLVRLGTASREEARALARDLQAAALTSQRIGEGLT